MSNKIKNLLKKKNKTKIVSLTAYSNNIAKILDKYCDITLVGDSVANVLYGMKNTHEINIDTIIRHSKSVKKGIKRSIMVVDMPKGSYKTPLQAKKNAKLIYKKTKCDAVKIESNNKNFEIIKEIRKANEYTWFPIIEVGKLFAGIFVTIIPAIAILKAGTKGALSSVVSSVSEDGEPINYMYFWKDHLLLV